MDRRGFLGSIIAACAAPAIVSADPHKLAVDMTPAEAMLELANIPPPSPTFTGSVHWDDEFGWLRRGFTGVANGHLYLRGFPLRRLA